MIKKPVLIPLGALLVLCFIGSGVLKNKRTGALHVVATASWLGFLALAVFFIVVAIITIVNNRRRLNRSSSYGPAVD